MYYHLRVIYRYAKQVINISSMLLIKMLDDILLLSYKKD